MFLLTPGYTINVNKSKDSQVVLLLDASNKLSQSINGRLNQEIKAAGSKDKYEETTFDPGPSSTDKCTSIDITGSTAGGKQSHQLEKVAGTRQHATVADPYKLVKKKEVNPAHLINQDVFIDCQLGGDGSEGIVDTECLYDSPEVELKRTSDCSQVNCIDLSPDETEARSNTLFVAGEEEVVSEHHNLQNLSTSDYQSDPDVNFGGQPSINSSTDYQKEAQQQQVVCEDCELILESVHSAKHHVVVHHSSSNRIASSSTSMSINRFERCQYCGLLSTNRKAHLRRIHFAHRKSAWLRRGSHESPRRRQYTCLKCNYTTCQLTNIRNHVDAKHGTDEKLHHCTDCNTAYKTINSLRAHKSRVHTKKSREKSKESFD